MVGNHRKLVQVTIIATVLALSGCPIDYQDVDSGYMKEWDGTFPTSYKQMPARSDLPAFKALAYSGDGKYANSVSTYYMENARGMDYECYWYLIAAQNGDRIGQHGSGSCYSSKLYSKYSLVRAKFWFKKSVEQGEEFAVSELRKLEDVKLLDEGGVRGKVVNEENFPLFRDVAYSGSELAANSIAVYVAPKDRCYWYAISAENGNPEGELNLAKCHADKESWMYSPHRVEFWLKRAANHGNEDAGRMLKALGPIVPEKKQ